MAFTLRRDSGKFVDQPITLSTECISKSWKGWWPSTTLWPLSQGS